MSDEPSYSASKKVVVQTGEDQHTWQVPEEVPTALIYNGLTFAVMLATPADLEDYALGFSLSEQIIRSRDELLSLDVVKRPQGIELHCTITDKAYQRLELREGRRNLTGRSGCGICGLDNMEALFVPLPSVADKPVMLDEELLAGAVGRFKGLQPMKALNHSVHGAAWVDGTGQVMLVREDVGRHNALDKLIGAMVHMAVNPKAGLCLMSSRCSYELVEKAAIFGMPALVALSAPTGFAIKRAAEAKLALATWSKGQLTRF